MNMTQAHTPGPWIARTQPNSKGQVTSIRIWTQDEFHGNLVCAMSPETPAAVQGHEAFANARLIAAAPDLLEALKNLYTACTATDFNEHWESYKEAQDAITKATGNIRQDALDNTQQAR